MFFCPVYGLDRAVDDRRAFHRVCVQGICDALRRDGGGKVPRRHQLANELWDSFEGRPAPEFAEGYWKTVEKFLNLMVDFMVQDDRNLVEWMRSIKAPVSVYMASDGLVGTLPEEYKEECACRSRRAGRFPSTVVILIFWQITSWFKDCRRFTCRYCVSSVRKTRLDYLLGS